MKIKAMVLAAIVLGGCAAERSWVKPGASQADFERDKQTCNQESMGDALDAAGGFGTSTYSTQRVQYYRKCMRERGWKLKRQN